MRREEGEGGKRQTEIDPRNSKTHAPNNPPHPRFCSPTFLDRDPPACNRDGTMVRYLLDAWHSTTSAPAEGNAFKEKDTHLRKAAEEGSNYDVTCCIGFCTLRRTKMESKKNQKNI